jgi:hypothetical protein
MRFKRAARFVLARLETLIQSDDLPFAVVSESEWSNSSELFEKIRSAQSLRCGSIKTQKRGEEEKREGERGGEGEREGKREREGEGEAERRREGKGGETCQRTSESEGHLNNILALLR